MLPKQSGSNADVEIRTLGRRPVGPPEPHVVSFLKDFTTEESLTLDIGCGPNKYAQFAQGRFIATDIRNDLYEGVGPNLLCSAECLPFKGSSFDLVMILSALQQIPDTDKVLSECRRVLKRGGKLAIFDYNLQVTRRIKKLDPQHVHSFTHLSLAWLLWRHGFRPRILQRPFNPQQGWKRWLVKFRWVRWLRTMTDGWIIMLGEKR